MSTFNAHQPCRAGRRGVVRMAVFVDVGMPMHVVVPSGCVWVCRANAVFMRVVMLVAMIVVMPVVKNVVMAVIVRVAISLLMRMAVIGFGTCVQVRHLMRMIVRLERMQVLDPFVADRNRRCRTSDDLHLFQPHLVAALNKKLDAAAAGTRCFARRDRHRVSQSRQ